MTKLSAADLMVICDTLYKRMKLTNLYRQTYLFYSETPKKKMMVSHHILPHFYKNRSLVIFSICKYRKNYFIFNSRGSFMLIGFKIWKNKMIELNIFGWQY